MQMTMGMRAYASKKIEKVELEKIINEHKAWLTDRNTGKCADLSDFDLAEIDLSGVDLSYANMQRAWLLKANFSGANLSNADLSNAMLHSADLSGAMVDETLFVNANLTMARLDGCKGKNTIFHLAHMWDCSIMKAILPGASFLWSKVCDCDFTGSDLEEACFACADLDNAIFTRTNLKNANLCFATRTYWSDFTDSDMTGISASEVDLDPENLKGVKGLYMPLYCPEEGAFVAWKKCREGKVVKLLIPETAERKGTSLYSCRASEAIVLEIFDRAGEPVGEAVSLIDKDFKYIKGEKAIPNKIDRTHLGDVEGIYFVLSRAETDYFEDKELEEEDDNPEE